MHLITERKAVRDAILAALKEIFTGAKAGDTLFVYLAGHGGIEGEDYYFVPYDLKGKSLAEGGVPLAEIKRLFDRTASRRVFLWLDFCHSGGILARGGKTDDLSVIRRSIGVVNGQGKVIIAACTPTQSAYEDPSGHGLFTDALLRGLKGEARSAQGEVTASSLYDFIDHQVKRRDQRPTFLGEMAGRLVLMHYPDPVAAPQAKQAKAAPTKLPAKASPATRITTSGDLLLLDGRVYKSRSVREHNDGRVEVEVVPKNGEEGAALRGLRSDQFARHKEVRFAFRDLAFVSRIEEVSSLTSGVKPAWSVTLKPADTSSSYLSDSGYNGLSVEDLARMRARLLLLGAQPDGQGSSGDTMLMHFVQGRLKELGLSEPVFTALGKQERSRSLEFLRRARLWAVYYLIVGGICDEVLDLRLGPIRAGKVVVVFRGRRKSRYSNGEPHEFTVEGECSLM